MDLSVRGGGVAKIRAAAGLTTIIGVLLLAGVAAADAHVSVEPTQAPAAGQAKLGFSVGHGCEGSPTTSITIQLPDQVDTAKPQAVPGWKVETDGVSEVTWKGGNLDPHQLQVFGLKVHFAGKPGDTAPFKVLQRCQEGEIAWIEIPEEGQPEPESPAPVVNLVAGGSDHANSEEAEHAGEATDGHDDAASKDEHRGDEDHTDRDETVAEDTTAAADTAIDESADDDGNGPPLPAIALVVAVVALLAAGVAYFKRRS